MQRLDGKDPDLMQLRAWKVPSCFEHIFCLAYGAWQLLLASWNTGDHRQATDMLIPIMRRCRCLLAQILVP